LTEFASPYMYLSSCVHNLGTRLRWVVCFALPPLYLRGTTSLGIHWIGDRVCQKSFTCAGNRTMIPPVRGLVTMPTELPQPLLGFKAKVNWQCCGKRTAVRWASDWMTIRLANRFRSTVKQSERVRKRRVSWRIYMRQARAGDRVAVPSCPWGTRLDGDEWRSWADAGCS